MIPAQPGYTYIELEWRWDEKDKERLVVICRHPVIAWAHGNGGHSGYAQPPIVPVMLVPRCSEQLHWAVKYPDSDRVVTGDGEAFDTVSKWIDDVRYYKEQNDKLTVKAAEKKAEKKEVAA